MVFDPPDTPSDLSQFIRVEDHRYDDPQVSRAANCDLHSREGWRKISKQFP
jgi:hypothetical protein